MPRYAIFAAFALVAVLAASPAAAQDVTLHQTTTSSGPMAGGAPANSTLYFGKNAMKHASADSDVIVRYDQNKIVFVDNKKKTYSESTFAEIEKAMADASAAMKGMDKESMEAMRKMMGGGAGEIKVTRQGAGENIAGYATEKYTISMPPVEMEVWTAPALTIPEAYYNAMRLQMPRNPMFDMGKIYDEMKKIKGLTVKSVMNMKMMNMAMTTTTVVTSVEKGTIPASTFEVPAGYKAAPFRGGMK